MTLVYGPFDQATLDREYDAFPAAAGFDKTAVYKLHSERAFASLERVPDLVYDEASGSKLDLYPGPKGSPLFVWVHGGYWRASTKNENAFVAGGLVPSGITVANVDYTLAPSVTLDEIVRQVRTSIAWLHRNTARFGVDANLIHIGGHSAGGQLIGMLLADEWKSAFQLPRDVIGAALGVSGLFDM
jgi:arylformamidase